MRRTRIDNDPTAQQLPEWRHHAFATNRTGNAVALDRDHRGHAVVELAIRDLRHGAGMNHCPSRIFNANAAWLIASTIAHNRVRWTQLIGHNSVEGSAMRNAATFRRRLLVLPGRITTTSRQLSLRLPTGWPWTELFLRDLTRLRWG